MHFNSSFDFCRSTFWLCLLIFSGIISRAQQISFEKTYDYGLAEAANCVQQTFDGGYILAGRQGVSIGTTYLMLIKTDSLGDVEWERFYGAPGEEQVAYSVQQTADSGYIISGYKTVPGKGADAYLMKTDASGDTLWTKHYGTNLSETGYSVRQTYDGGYVVAARWRGDTASLIRTGQSGEILWRKEYLPNGHEASVAFSVVQTPDSGFCLAGATYPNDILGDVYVVRTDKHGDTLWNRWVGGPDNERGQGIDLTRDGGFIVTGYTWSYGAGNADVYLIRMDTNGDTLWTHTYGDTDSEAGLSVQQTNDWGFIIGGFFHWPSNNYDMWLVKTDSTGQMEWERKYGGPDVEGAESVIQTTDGGYALCGLGQDASVTGAVYFVKTDSLGGVITGKYSAPQPMDFNVSIYPNPMRDKAYVELEGIPPSSGMLTFTLFDQLGRVVKQLTFQNFSFVVDREGLPAGIYVFRMEYEGDIIGSGKVCVY